MGNRQFDVCAVRFAMDFKPLSQPSKLLTRKLEGLDAHSDFCKRFRSNAYKMPWERGMLSHEPLPLIQPWTPEGPFPILNQLNPFDAEQSALRSEPGSTVNCYKSAGLRLQKVVHGMTWYESLDASRALALKKWFSVLTLGGVNFDLVAQHYAVQSSSHIWLIDALESALTAKSTATLYARANPVLRFVKWCKDSALTPFPIDAVIVFKYLTLMKDVCAPTFPRSLLGSVAFMTFCLGLTSGKTALDSSLISGLTTSLYLEEVQDGPTPGPKGLAWSEVGIFSMWT